jgi:hypothetical protein
MGGETSSERRWPVLVDERLADAWALLLSRVQSDSTPPGLLPWEALTSALSRGLTAGAGVSLTSNANASSLMQLQVEEPPPPPPLPAHFQPLH